MNRYVMLLACAFLFVPVMGWSQNKPAKWDLSTCIDYALEHNIQIQKSKIVLKQGVESTKEAKSRLLPSLSFSTGHNLVNRPKSVDSDQNSYNGTYGFSSSVAVYNGGKLRNVVQQNELQNRIQKLTIQETGNDIELAITESFLQVLYAGEAVRINQNTLEVSQVQLDRSKALLAAGSISSVDYAQMESQYSTDKYQLVVAQTTLDNQKLQLKQLLELDIQDEMDLVIPELPDDEVLTLLPAKRLVYETSLKVMPQIEYNRLNIDLAGLGKTNAKAGYLPTLNLTAGIGSGHVSGTGYSFATQMKNSFNESIGLTLNVPIFSNRSNKTAVKIAQLKIDDSELTYRSVQKDLLQKVETAYLDATSSQDRFRAASETLLAVGQSFKLTEEQFYLGMKNTLELLTEKNNLLSAQQEVLQAKYMAILNRLLLNFYQGNPIALK